VVDDRLERSTQREPEAAASSGGYRPMDPETAPAAFRCQRSFRKDAEMLDAGVRSLGLSAGAPGSATLSIIFQTAKSRTAAKPSAPIASMIFFTIAGSKAKL
jgi:hypothetical protein